jgi:hypothetical protein
MSIYERFFKSRQHEAGPDLKGVRVIPTKCPVCGEVGEFDNLPEAHNMPWGFKLDEKTVALPLECAYCRAGMLLCIRDGRAMGIEPFKDDPPGDVLQAVARTRAKLGI